MAFKPFIDFSKWVDEEGLSPEHAFNTIADNGVIGFMALSYPDWFSVKDVYYIDASKLFQRRELKDVLEANRVLAHQDHDTPNSVAAQLDVAISKPSALQHILLFGMKTEEKLDPGADEAQEVWVGGLLFYRSPKKPIPHVDTLSLGELQEAFYKGGGAIFYLRPLGAQHALCSLALTVSEEKLTAHETEQADA